MNETEQELELALKMAESRYGADGLEVAACLESYAKILRQRMVRLLVPQPRFSRFVISSASCSQRTVLS